jgi:hypothetical protein
MDLQLLKANIPFIMNEPASAEQKGFHHQIKITKKTCRKLYRIEQTATSQQQAGRRTPSKR